MVAIWPEISPVFLGGSWWFPIFAVQYINRNGADMWNADEASCSVLFIQEICRTNSCPCVGGAILCDCEPSTKSPIVGNWFMSVLGNGIHEACVPLFEHFWPHLMIPCHLCIVYLCRFTGTSVTLVNILWNNSGMGWIPLKMGSVWVWV